MAHSPAAADPIFLSRCPHCAATYAVPAERMGVAGARIHCPDCDCRYDLRRRPEAVLSGAAQARDGAHDSLATPDPFAGAGPEVVARITVEELGEALAREMVAADAEGSLFARHGAEILDAFDRYRERAGRGAPADAFRDALRERFGIELPAWVAGE
jgi:predicted Zn finger-like uncharacterized protein